MTNRKPTFAVLGTGNSGQTYAADITLKGYDVNLAELPAFAENLTAIEKTDGGSAIDRRCNPRGNRFPDLCNARHSARNGFVYRDKRKLADCGPAGRPDPGFSENRPSRFSAAHCRPKCLAYQYRKSQSHCPSADGPVQYRKDRGDGGKGWNLYAEGATESVARVMVALDHERVALLERIGMKPLSLEETLVRLYAAYGLGRESLSDTLRKSPIHGNPIMEAPERINTRYLSEDVPFGLATWSVLGRLWGVKTPYIDATLTIASAMLGRDCFADSLSAEDLGIRHLQPEAVCAFVE